MSEFYWLKLNNILVKINQVNNIKGNSVRIRNVTWKGIIRNIKSIREEQKMIEIIDKHLTKLILERLIFLTTTSICDWRSAKYIDFAVTNHPFRASIDKIKEP